MTLDINYMLNSMDLLALNSYLIAISQYERYLRTLWKLPKHPKLVWSNIVGIWWYRLRPQSHLLQIYQWR